MASPGVAVSNGDGTFTILINAVFSESRQREALNHERHHLKENHFYRDCDEISELEDEANNCEVETDPSWGQSYFTAY